MTEPLAKEGVIYVAVGQRWLEEAVYSATTFKKFNPKLPITLFTNKNYPKTEIFDTIKIVEDYIDPFKYKIWAMMHSPYERTLYIDTDTEIKGALYEIYQHLDHADIAIAGMRWMDRDSKPAKLVAYEMPSPFTNRHIVYNTGVVAFRKSATFQNFVHLWYDKIKIGAKPGIGCDQDHFNKMLGEDLDIKLNLKIAKIPNTIYNARMVFFEKMKQDKIFHKIKIIHEHGLNLPFLQKKIYFLKRKVGKYLQKYNLK
jgi:hypothetical protein